MGTIDLNLLRYFETVAQTGSFTGAASRLGVPKSSVSRGISALENEIGVRLLHRTTRSVSLTSAGERFFERVHPLLAALEQSVELPEVNEKPAGLLRVTASVDFGVAVLGPLLPEFVRRFPDLEVDLRLTNALVDLVAEGFDVALRIAGQNQRLKDSTLAARSAGKITLQLFAAPSYLDARGIPKNPPDLENHEWVAFRPPAAIRLESRGRQARVTPSGALRCDDMLFAREAVRAGAGIGLLPTFLVRDDVTTGSLVRLLPRWDISSGTLWIVHPSTVHVPRKVVVFREFILEALMNSS